MSSDLTWLDGVIMRGHGLASGVRGCQDIGGTIKAQRPFFEQQGIDLSACHNGTINVDISPFSFSPLKPFKTVRKVKWHADWPEEDFSFFHAVLETGGKQYEGLVYLPHPETKPSVFLGHSMLELLLPFIKEIQYDQMVKVAVDPSELLILKNN